MHDQFFLKAKAEGYAARSAYKLKEISERRKIFRKNDKVLDLGCSPGSWVQVAAELIGPHGRVVGIDLKPVEIALPENARTRVGDAFKVSAQELWAMMEGVDAPQPGTSEAPSASLKPPFNVVLSDMAPNTEGGAGGSGDHFRSVELCRRVLELADALLRPGGNLVMKVFEGEAYPELLKETSRKFDECKGFKPEASRDVSREMFIVAKGFKGGVAREPKRDASLAGPAPKPRAGWGGGDEAGRGRA